MLRGLLARGAAPTDIAVLSPYNAQMDLDLGDKRLTSVPAAIRELRAAGCRVDLDYGVTVDE